MALVSSRHPIKNDLAQPADLGMTAIQKTQKEPKHARYTASTIKSKEEFLGVVVGGVGRRRYKSRFAYPANVMAKEQIGRLYRRYSKCFGNGCFPRMFGSSRQNHSPPTPELNSPEATKHTREHEVKDTHVVLQRKSNEEVDGQGSPRQDLHRTTSELHQQQAPSQLGEPRLLDLPNSRSPVTQPQMQSPPTSPQQRAQKGPNLTSDEQSLLQGVAKEPARRRKTLADFGDGSDNALRANQLLQRILEVRRHYLHNQRHVAPLGHHPQIPQHGDLRFLRPDAQVSFRQSSRYLSSSSRMQSPSPRTPQQNSQQQQRLGSHPLFLTSPETSSRSSVTDNAPGLDLRPQIGPPPTNRQSHGAHDDSQLYSQQLHSQLLRSHSLPWDIQHIAANNILAQHETQPFDLSHFNRLASENVRGWSRSGSSPIGTGQYVGLKRTQSDWTSGDRTTREGSYFSKG